MCRDCDIKAHSARYRAAREAAGHAPRVMGPQVPWRALGENVPMPDSPEYRTRRQKRNYYNARYKARKTYGISLEEYRELMHKNDGWCALCLEKHEQKEMVLDHDHGTNVLRGVICRKCNTGLGMFGDSPERLALALHYLSRNGKKVKWPEQANA